MKKFSIKGVGLAAVAALCLLTAAGCNSAPQQGGLRTGKIDANDRLESKDVVASAAPVSGAPSVQVTETLHYINEPAFSHNTQYQINRTETASWVERVGAFVLHDEEGDWYTLHAGSTAAAKGSKPQASIGSRPSKLDSNDQGSVSSVVAGASDGANPTLKVTYTYTHPEALDDLQYTVTGQVGTTYVQDQNAWFAYVGGNDLYRVDRGGQVTRLNDKPTVDRGEQRGLIDRNDSTDPNPGVGFDGNFFQAHWTHVHEQDFEHVRYTTLQEVRGDYVREVNAYMAWIGGTEYSVTPPSNFVQRLNQRPIVNLGGLPTNIGYDRPARVDVFSVTNKDVVVRYSFHRNETYIAKEYYVDRPGVLYYNQTWQVWEVAIDGHSYVVAWDSDNFGGDPSVTVLHAPAGSARPQYVVPSTSGDGLPPAVVPGRDNGSQDTPAPSGIPGRTPQTIPGRAPAAPQGIPGRAPAAPNCIPGRPC